MRAFVLPEIRRAAKQITVGGLGQRLWDSLLSPSKIKNCALFYVPPKNKNIVKFKMKKLTGNDAAESKMSNTTFQFWGTAV